MSSIDRWSTSRSLELILGQLEPATSTPSPYAPAADNKQPAENKIQTHTSCDSRRHFPGSSAVFRAPDAKAREEFVLSICAKSAAGGVFHCSRRAPAFDRASPVILILVANIASICASSGGPIKRSSVEDRRLFGFLLSCLVSRDQRSRAKRRPLFNSKRAGERVCLGRLVCVWVQHRCCRNVQQRSVLNTASLETRKLAASRGGTAIRAPPRVGGTETHLFFYAGHTNTAKARTAVPQLTSQQENECRGGITSGGLNDEEY